MKHIGISINSGCMLVAASIALASTSYAFEEIGPSSVKLEPSAEPALPTVGYREVALRNGEEVTYTVTAVSDKVITYESSQGCSWNTPVKDHVVSPSEDWSNCSGSSGIAKVKAKKSLFPLKKGKKASYSLNGKTTQGSWTGSWSDKYKCKVKKSVRVKTQMGEYDTWKVVCKGQNDKKTYYYSPELENTVMAMKKHYTKPDRNWTNELLSVE